MYQSWREWPTRSICRSARVSHRTVRRTTRAVRPAPARRVVRARAARTRWIAIRVRRAAAAIRSVSAPGRTAATASNEISVTVRPDRRVYLSCGLRTIVVFERLRSLEDCGLWMDSRSSDQRFSSHFKNQLLQLVLPLRRFY